MTIPPDKSDRISEGAPLTPGRATSPTTPEKGGFESRMQGSPTAPQTSGAPQGPSPAQVPQGPGAPQGAPTIESIQAQASSAQDGLGAVKDKLNTKNLSFSSSQEHLLRNKFSNTSTYLRAANAKLGADAPPMPTQTGKGPIAKFLNYVTDGENQLNAAKAKLQDISKGGESINPADMMLVQIKMNQAQQEIEYSSTLLSKVITSLTQILNTQL